MRRRLTGRGAIALVVGAGALLATVCAVALGAVGGTAPVPTPAPGLPAAQTVQAVPAAEAEAFAILRRPLVPGDAIPDGGALVARLGKGANVEIARRADAGVGTPRWVIPAADGVCLTAEVDGAFGATCASLEDAQAGREVLTLTGGPGRGSDETTVVALAPDGADGALLELSDGSTRTLQVSGNTADGTVTTEPTAIRWQLADGTTRDTPVYTG